MRYDFLREPISADDPCGPDLEESLDADYNNYVQEAAGLIPERFYDRSQNRLFDRSKINVDQNEGAIAALLKRTRDIRLLVLDARLQLLGTKLIGFTEALEGLQIVVSGFWDTFHPLPLDGDMILRQNTLEGLDDLRVIIPALQFTTVVEGRSRLTYRNYLVATGKVEPWEAEEIISRDAVDRILYDENNRKQLTDAHEAVVGGLAALDALRNTFIEHAGHVNAPAFDKLVEQLTNMRAFLEEYLGIGSAEEATAGEGDATGEAPAVLGAVTTHGAAAAALKAAEDYFLKTEPSSPVLILVHQARLLLGRPLIEALETLLSEPSARATMRFEAGYRFELDLTRMKLVTDDLLASAAAETPADGDSWSSSGDSWSDSGESSSEYGSEDSSASADESAEAASDAGEEPAEAATDESESETAGEAAAEGSEETPAPSLPSAVGTTVELKSPTTFVANTRLEASQLLSAVESFFKQVEPSSPIPTLLIRARSYFGKDFSAILNEMMPPEPASGSE